MYQFILTLFQTLHAKRHTAQIGNLLFGIPQGKMSQKTLIVLINLIVNQRLGTHKATPDTMFESLYYLLEYGLIENQTFTAHTAGNITSGEQFATLQNNSVATSIEHIHPEFLIKYLSCKDKDLNPWIILFGVSAQLNAHSGRATKSQVEQHQIGLMLLHELKIVLLIVCSSNNYGFGNLIFEDTFCSFEFERNILYYDYLKFFHICKLLRSWLRLYALLFGKE
ncbi:unknown [Prevotella sp. CAG:474]|nr:unknown [Prevotella sp. CAG:474]